jgi:hypothetical protein
MFSFIIELRTPKAWYYNTEFKISGSPSIKSRSLAHLRNRSIFQYFLFLTPIIFFCNLLLERIYNIYNIYSIYSTYSIYNIYNVYNICNIYSIYNIYNIYSIYSLVGKPVYLVLCEVGWIINYWIEIKCVIKLLLIRWCCCLSLYHVVRILT